MDGENSSPLQLTGAWKYAAAQVESKNENENQNAKNGGRRNTVAGAGANRGPATTVGGESKLNKEIKRNITSSRDSKRKDAKFGKLFT